MNTNRTTRFAGLLVAVLMTVAINGAMLWKFDAISQEAVLATNGQTATVVTLDRVNVVAHRS
jgi:hypothetical protein